MKPQSRKLLLGLLQRLTDLLEQESGLFFKERPFLIGSTDFKIVSLSDEDQVRKEQVEIDMSSVVQTLHAHQKYILDNQKFTQDKLI